MLQPKVFKYIFLAVLPLFIVVGFTLIKSNTAYGVVECGGFNFTCGNSSQNCSFCVGDDCPCYTVCSTCYEGQMHITKYCEDPPPDPYGPFLYSYTSPCDYNDPYCSPATCPNTGCYNDFDCAPDDGCTDNYCDLSGGLGLGTCRSIDLCGGGGGTPTPTPSVGPNFNVDIVQAPGVVSKAQGDAATYDINIAPQNNYSGTVSLTISGCPSGASCGFSPSSVAFVNDSPNPGTSVLTVNNTGGLVPAVYPFTVTGTDTVPEPDLVDSDTSDLTITQSLAAVCDSTWRDMPDSTYVNAGQISAAQDNGGVFLYWPLQYRDSPYYSGGFIQNKCVFGGSVCVWQRSEMTQADFSGSQVYAQDTNNVFVRGDPNCQTYWGCPGTSYTTLKFSPPWSWTNMGDISKPWSTPTSVTDKDGRSWQFQVVGYSPYRAQYRCSPPTLSVNLTADPSTGSSPLNLNLEANVGGTATGTINYSFWWNCTNTSTSVATVEASCGTLPVPSSGSCASNANGYKCLARNNDEQEVSHIYNATSTAKVIVERGAASPAEARAAITIANPPPTVPSVTVTEPDYCSSFGAYINWTYSDSNGDPQSAYQVQIDEQGSFGSPEVDTGKISGSGTSYFASSGLVFNITYKARVRVWDSYDTVSNWTESGSWKTPKHAYPYVDFTYSPLIDIPAKQPVQFTDQTTFYDGGGGTRVWSWVFGDGGTSSQQNQSHTYNLPGLYQASLTATDKDNYSCSRTKPITIQLPIPVWKEVSPR